MRSDWPEVTLMDAITGDTIRRQRRPVVPRTGEIVSIHPEFRWRVSEVIHDGDTVDVVTGYLIPILAILGVPNDND